MINWIKFAEQQPIQKGYYLICYDNHGVKEVKHDYWPNKDKGMYFWNIQKVIYWAELNYPE